MQRISSTSLTTFSSSSGFRTAERYWWSHHLLRGVQWHADCLYLEWIIEWDEKEHFISASKIINHCHYLRFFPSATCPNPQLHSLNKSSVWHRRQPDCIWIPDAVSGFSSACVWKVDYNLLLATSLSPWRAEKFWPWNWMWVTSKREITSVYTQTH